MSSANDDQKRERRNPGATNRPAVEIHIDRDDSVHPGDFSPLSTPRDIRVSTLEVTPSLMQRLRASLAVELSAGEYLLSIFEDEPLPTTVPPDCRAHLTLSAGTPSGADDATPMITGMEISFDKPLVLGNILAILAKLQTRFADHELTAFIANVSKALTARKAVRGLRGLGRDLLRTVTGRFPDAADAAGLDITSLKAMGAALGKSAKESATVHIERISARPVSSRKGWQLELRFTGEWDFAGQMKIPFHQVRVHRAILPSPHALLDNLLSSEPLATATLRRGRTDALRLAQEFGTMISSFSGRVSGAGLSPDLATTIHTADGGCLEMDGAGDQQISLHARLTGKVSPTALELSLDRGEMVIAGEKIGLDATFSGWTGHSPSDAPAQTAIGRCFESLYSGEWSSDKLSFRLETHLAPGSRFAGFDVGVRYQHPLLKGESNILLSLSDIELEGAVGVEFGTPADWSTDDDEQASPQQGTRPDVNLAFKCKVDVLEGSRIGTGRACAFPRCKGAAISGSLSSAGLSGTVAQVKGLARGRIDLDASLAPFPELSIEEGRLKGTIEGSADFDARVELNDTPSQPVEADFTGTSLELNISRTSFEVDRRRLTLPAKSVIKGQFESAVLQASGLGSARVGVAWDLAGESPLLKYPGGSVELFLPPLRKGEFDLHLSPSGGISISGEEWGLFDARYFNALINPEAEPERILDILRSREALDRVFDTIAAFSTEAVDLLTKIRNFVQDAEEALDKEGISQPGDAVPGPMLARLLSRIVFDGKIGEDDLYPLVKQVTDGKGLNVSRIKQLINDFAPDHEHDFELDRLLRLSGRLLSPAEPPEPPARLTAIPLSETPEYLRRYAAIPAAKELYDAVGDDHPIPLPLQTSIARVAPYLTLEQVDYLLSREREDWIPSVLNQLTHVLELKRRVRDISQGYGGVAYAPQAMAISFFLGETIRRSQSATPLPDDSRSDPRNEGYEFGRTLLGPEDLAVLASKVGPHDRAVEPGDEVELYLCISSHFGG